MNMRTLFFFAFVLGLPARVMAQTPLPTIGEVHANLASFDQAMQKFLGERGIRAATLAVSKDGRLVLSRGYGHLDPEGKRLLSPLARLRIASISKPITAAAIRKLIHDGKLALDTPVFDLLAVSPPEGTSADPRLKRITVQHLLEHRGGWDRDSAGDPMFRPLEIAKALGKPGPASSDDVVRYMAGQPLQFDPGTKSRYSNFGYCVLGRVIEKVTKKSYSAHVQEAIFAPLGITKIELGRTLPKDRKADEPFYEDSGRGRNVMDPSSRQTVPAPDGTFHLEAMDAHGGFIASSVDLTRFLSAYWLSGEPRRAGSKGEYAFFGSLPGTFTMVMQRPDGVDLAVLLNQRRDPSGLDYFEIRRVMNEAADAVKSWPGK